MSTPLGFIWSLVWHNPYTAPPGNLPRVAAEIYVPCDHPGQGARKPGQLAAALTRLNQAGITGYSITCTALAPEIKPMAPETLAGVRQKRLQRRLQQNAPLLADHLIQDELAARPDYYAGQTDAGIESARDATLAAEAQRRQRFTSTPNQLHFYLDLP